MLWSSESLFSYTSLPPASSEVLIPFGKGFQEHRIRLLRLSWTSTLSKTPQCKLKTSGIQIGDPTPIDCRALSYVHGRDDDDQDIKINGKRFRVSANLYDCLEVLSKDSRRWGNLWVDQICINNSSVPERSRQVKFMGEIYRRAKEVVVWLGRGIFSDFAAVDIIHKLYEEEQHQEWEAYLNQDERNLLVSFIRNPYFERVWAVQELVLAQSIVLLIGDREVSWNALIAVYSKHVVNQKWSSLRDITDDCTSLQRISIARTQRTILGIFDVLNGFCNYKCFDSRDHLFALYGLIGGDVNGGHTIRYLGGYGPDITANKLALVVDYSLSLEAVLLNFCYELLEKMSETSQLFDLLVRLAHAMGFDGVFYGGCLEDEIMDFFAGAGVRSGTHIQANVRNKLQARTDKFREAADFLAIGVPIEYDMLSGKRIGQLAVKTRPHTPAERVMNETRLVLHGF